MPAPVIIGVNYHRIGDVDPANPYHRLHTVPHEVFTRQLDWMRARGAIVSPDQVRAADVSADVNFVVCFDDVPISALTGIDLLRSQGLPVTLSPAGVLADDGLGCRDKVYAIEKYAAPERIAQHVADHLPEAARLQGTFYHLTKSPDLDPYRVRTRLIDPLYATVQDRGAPFFAERGYLTWPQLRELARDPQVTVANHTYQHDNLTALSRDAVRAEVERAHTHFTRQMGAPARYFTVPFGRLTQELALDLLDPLVSLGYEGILWVGSGGVSIHGPYKHQVLHLIRVHAAETANGFTDQVNTAVLGATRAAIWQVPEVAHHRPVQIAEGSTARRAGALEMVLRQGKDYASDPAYFHHQFTANPYRGTRADYCTVEVDGYPEAIAYRFHTPFAVDGRRVPGIYLSGWRKLPHAHATAAGRLLRTLLDHEPVVGVYRPNPEIHTAFRAWHRIRVTQLDLPASAHHRSTGPSAFSAEERSAFPADCEDLCATSVQRAGFTVARDGAYHCWRHAAYPAAPATFLSVRSAGRPTGIAVTLHLRKVTHVVDFHLAAHEDPDVLLAAVQEHAAEHGSTAVRWETTNAPLIHTAVERHGATITPYDNFYRFNSSQLAAHGVALSSERWSELQLHETATTSDVLPR
ncbi:polysaccharide deacetylase family protein [Streptomyces prunicolor]|uniref:polysaccharide deacetylase family protein n=1 Tax=Streptomyces prunicolor TaxID=67348 RepID=UPI0037205148